MIVGYQIKRVENKFTLKTAREGSPPLNSLLYLYKRLSPSTEYILPVVRTKNIKIIGKLNSRTRMTR